MCCGVRIEPELQDYEPRVHLTLPRVLMFGTKPTVSFQLSSLNGIAATVNPIASVAAR